MSAYLDPADDDSAMWTAPAADIYDLPTFTASGPTAWRTERACADMPVDVFFPGRGQNGAVAAAKAICNGCPVKAECLTDALSDPMISGIWGATSHRQRRIIRSANNPVESARHRKDIEHGTNAGYQAHNRRPDDPGPCAPCISAHTAYRREAQARRRAINPATDKAAA
jgi:WhiB family redox-sensing transcriptional regulator